MNPVSNSAGGASGTLSNGTYATIVAPFRAPIVTGVFSGQPIDIAHYTISLNVGVTAGTATFQELFADKITWVNLATPAPLSLSYGTVPTYQGTLNGPFWGLQVVISGLTGGTVQLIQLIASIRTL